MMLFSTSSLLATAAFSLGSLVSAQETSWTPAGFSPAVAAKLEVIYGTKASTTPGTSYTKAETARQPTIGTSDAPLNGTYMWLLIDLDVPANFQNPSAGGRRTNLHALITGFKSSGQTVNGVYTLTSTSTGPITYVGPSPPAENPPYPHKYVSLLYETPGGFTVTRAQVGQTFGFNLTTFLSTVKITEAPVRANYLTVTG